MSDDIVTFLKNSYSLSDIHEEKDTEECTIFSATSTENGARRTITVYKQSIEEFRKEELLDLHKMVRWITTPAVDLQDFTITENGQLLLVSVNSTGTKVSDYLQQRTQRGTPLGTEEIVNLLQDVAAAVDSFNNAGCADFLAGKLDSAHLDVAESKSHTSFLLVGVGPGLYPTNTSPRENIDAFVQMCTGLIEGAPLRDRTDFGSAGEVLKELREQKADPNSRVDKSQSGTSATPWASTGVDAGARWDTAGSENSVKTSSPQQVFPDQEDTIWDLGGQGSAWTGGGTVSTVSRWGDRAQENFSPEVAHNLEPAYEPTYDNQMGGARPTYVRDSSASKPKVGSWIALLVVLVLLGVLGLVGYIFREPILETYREVVLGESEWTDDDVKIVDAFPGIVGERDGAEGWNGLSCESRPPAKGKEATISCADERLNVTIHRFANRSERDMALPGGDMVVIGNDTCQVTSKEITDQKYPAYVLAPSGDKDLFMIVVNGPDSEQKRLELPICDTAR